MSLSEIITDSVKYPFSNITNFLIVGILTLLAGISNVFTVWGITDGAVFYLGIIISFIFALFLSGYSLNIIRTAMDKSDDFPMLDPVNNIIDGIKVIIISIVFFIIPFVIALVLAIITGAIGAGLEHLFTGFGIALIISVIVFVIFAIFEVIALARFAKTKEFGDAVNFGEIFEDIKRIGVAKVIAFIIIALIIIVIVQLICSVLAFIPILGALLAAIIGGAFTVLFYNRGIGLLYIDQ